MNKNFLLVIVSFFFLTGVSYSQENPAKEFELLKKMSEKGEWTFRDFQIVLEFEQPVDHNNPEGPKFTQRVFLKHRDFDKPMVLHTRGYYARPGSETELKRILDCNEVEVEHRYFSPSAPDPLDWQYLTIEQAANDFHKVAEYLKQFYKGKWISTGGSKGGQSAIYQEYFFPEDVDVTVPYVAPINLAMEDERIPAYLADSISTPEARERMLNAQRAILERRDEIMPLVLKGIEESETEFAADTNVCYEYGVFETSFSWWQYKSGDFNEIPLPDAPAEELYQFLLNGLTFFYKTKQNFFMPFNYQAYTQVGFYGYDTTPFKDLLQYVKTDWAPNRQFMILPDWDIEFDPEPMNKIHDFLMTEGNNFIYIYGEYDPWTSTGVWPNAENTNSIRMTLPAGNHGTGILSFKGEEREKILTRLEKWLDVEISRFRLQFLER